MTKNSTKRVVRCQRINQAMLSILKEHNTSYYELLRLWVTERVNSRKE